MATTKSELDRLIPLRRATFTEEEKRKLVEGTNAQGRPLTEKENMELSKMHTARTLGADWRERAAERMKASEPARAQQALEERAAANRKTQYESPLQETVTKTQINLPGGGKVKYGIDTLASMRDFETKQAEEKAALQAKREGALSAMREKSGNALRQRYEDELASRGFAPPKTRQEAEAISRAKREEFDLARQSRQDADLAEKTALRDYSNFKQAARQARRDKDFGNVAYYENKAAEINEFVGGDIRNATARKSFFQDQAGKDLMREVNARSEARREKTRKQTVSNPEASSFTPTSSAAPLAVGVDFSSISPYNTAGTTTTGTTAPASQPATPKSTTEFPTSTQQTIEDVLPGASNMPVVQRNPNETPAQHNERVLQEYTNNVIIPSFDKETQDAVRSAIELNKQESNLYGQRFAGKGKEYEEVSKNLKKDQQVIIKSMKELKSKLRDLKNYPMNSKERTFLENQIGTLNNQLGFFDKLLN